MAYNANPFLERVSDRTSSDQDFVRLFSPKVLERLDGSIFFGGVHVFSSPPGGGKTTLLRAFTPASLKAFWNARKGPNMSEAHQRLVEFGTLDDEHGPQLLAALLSCASGYADLPAGATNASDGIFRALLNCRIILRTVRNLATFLNIETDEDLSQVRILYKNSAANLSAIPALENALEILRWAEAQERHVYSKIDNFSFSDDKFESAHARFEGVLWMQDASFYWKNSEVAKGRLLMIDDMHKLRKRQRALLLEELVELRPSFPIWLAERNIALGDELISQGTRQNRDVRHYPMEDLWGLKSPAQFASFAANILLRRIDAQTTIPSGPFTQYISDVRERDDITLACEKGERLFRKATLGHNENPRYREWLQQAEKLIANRDYESLKELYVTRILLARDVIKPQMTLDIAPLPVEELENRDSSQVKAASEVFMHEEIGVPYYFGMESICTLATYNVEELLAISAALYDALVAKQILRKPNLNLSAQEQEKIILEVARKKVSFIPKSHSEGTKAKNLLDGIGNFCRSRTFQANAPYAPGVTGVKLSFDEIDRTEFIKISGQNRTVTLRKVLSECVAENLLVKRPSAPTTGREGGLVFYLNRTLCAAYGLPLQFGGWQEVTGETMRGWIERGPTPAKISLGV